MAKQKFVLYYNLHEQQTPNPDAQLPALDPPLDEHSSLRLNRN